MSLIINNNIYQSETSNCNTQQFPFKFCFRPFRIAVCYSMYELESSGMEFIIYFESVIFICYSISWKLQTPKYRIKVNTYDIILLL